MKLAVKHWLNIEIYPMRRAANVGLSSNISR
jgi:hypothetical protein